MRKQEEHAKRFLIATTNPYTPHFGHGDYSSPCRFLVTKVIKFFVGPSLFDFDFGFPSIQVRPQSVRVHEHIFLNESGLQDADGSGKQSCLSLRSMAKLVLSDVDVLTPLIIFSSFRTGEISLTSSHYRQRHDGFSVASTVGR